MKQLFTSKVIFFLITTTVILSLNLIPLIMQFRHSPPGRTFALIHNNVQDFFFYQSLMNEGANGAWFTSDPYTSEPHQSSIIFSYFLWLGKLSKLLGLPYAITYHLARIILGVFLLSVICYLLFFLKIPYPRLTYLFFLFAAPFMHKTADSSVVPYMNWWTGMDPIRRVAYLPHHMFGGLFLVISIILIIKFFSLSVIPTGAEGSLTTKLHDERFLSASWRIGMTRIKQLFLLIFISALLAFIHTPSLLIILLFLPPAVMIYRIQLHQDKKLHPTKSSGSINLWGLSLYWLVGIIFLIIMITQTNHGFPWSQYIDWEKKLQFPLDKELIGALGILFPFSLLGAWQALKSKKFEYIFITCWLFVPFLFIPIAPKIGLSNIRLIQGVPYLPMAILAVLGIDFFIKIIISQTSKVKWLRSPFGQALDVLRNRITKRASSPINNQPVLLIFCVLFIIFTFPTLKWSLQDQIREYWPIFGNVYLDNRLNSAFAFINQNFPAKTITLSTFYTGNYLPAFTRTISFIGHFGYTYNVEEKQEKVRKFFEAKMTDEEAKEFLLNNKITLVWQGPEEKPIYNSYLYPKILSPVYDKEEVTIYTIYTSR